MLQRLQYIESNGNQYIYTGICNTKTLNSRYIIDYDILISTGSGAQCMMSAGNEGSESDSTICYGTSMYHYNASSINYVANVGYKYNNIFTDATSDAAWNHATREIFIDVNNSMCYCYGYNSTNGQMNNISFAIIPERISILYQICLFGWGNSSLSSPSYKSKARMYSCKMIHGDNVVANFVPCLDTSTSKAGLYDTVRCEFFPSYSTTAFIAGPTITSDDIKLKKTGITESNLFTQNDMQECKFTGLSLISANNFIEI